MTQKLAVTSVPVDMAQWEVVDGFHEYLGVGTVVLYPVRRKWGNSRFFYRA